MRWMIGRHSYAELKRQHYYLGQGEDRPIRWEGFLAEQILKVTGNPVEYFTFSRLGKRGWRLFAWNPGFEATCCAITGQLIFTAWGTRGRSHASSAFRQVVRRWAMRTILGRARLVLVNETTTAEEIRKLVDRDARVVPHFIDTEYWSFCGGSDRQDFLFCPSTVDRDGDVLVDLARAGHKVLWLANNSEIYERFRVAHRNLTVIKEIGFSHMRTLYQTCRAVVLPLQCDYHPAGQTTAMEAVACGAPVYISMGRTSSIFKDFPSVCAVAKDDWVDTRFSRCLDEQAERSATRLRFSHIPSLISALSKILVKPE